MSELVYRWQPTTEEIAAHAGIDPSQVLRFDHNTSPYRPHWAPTVAGEAALKVNEYPGADYRELRTLAAAYQGVEPDQVVPGAGADELIILCARTFCPPGGRTVLVGPTYPMYAIATAQREAEPIELRREPRTWALPADALVERAGDAHIVWLCEPNNPTGDRAPDALVEAVLDAAAGIVVVDAAYAEFTDDRWGRLVDRHDNLVVLHTMSKAFSLAGARVGYAVASPTLAARLHARRPPGSVSRTSQALAVEAFRRADEMRTTVARLREDRARLAAALADRFDTVYPSVTNFLLTRVGDHAVELSERLMWEDGVVVRAFPDDPDLRDHLRFTVRTPEQHTRLLAAIDRQLTILRRRSGRR